MRGITVLRFSQRLAKYGTIKYLSDTCSGSDDPITRENEAFKHLSKSYDFEEISDLRKNRINPEQKNFYFDTLTDS